MAYILNRASVLHRTIFHKNIIFGPITKVILVKNSGHFIHRTNFRAEQRFKLLDNISNDYRLIYRDQRSVNVLIAIAYNGGWIGLFAGILILGYIIIKDPPVQKERIEGTYGFIKPLTKLSRVVILFSGLVMCILLIIVSKIIPFRIYHSAAQKSYKAVFASNLLGKKNILTYSEGTVTPKFKFLKDTLFDVNGHTVLLDRECFSVPSICEHMLHKVN